MTNLDLLRAVAVLCVFFSHLIDNLGLFEIRSLGRFGVVIFFVHTSLVLMASLGRLDAPGLSGKWRLTEAFYIRRWFRIYPLAMLAVVSTLVFHIPIETGEKFYWVGTKAFVSNLALTQNLTFSPSVLSVLWSLPLEVQMYLLLPLAYFVVRNGKYRSLALWVLSVVLALTLPKVSSRLNVFDFAPCFTSGIVAYDLSRTPGWKLPAWTFPPALLAMIAISGPFDNVGLSIPGKLPLAWGLSLALALILVHTHDGAWPKVYPLSHWIAEHSYGIYLSHIVIFWFGLYQIKAAPMWLKLTVIAIGSAVLPWLLYRSIERPLIQMGVKFAKLLRPAASASDLLISRTGGP